MLVIRDAVKEDVGTILKLIKMLAEYEKEPKAVEITEQDLLEDGFSSTSPPRFHCFIAEENGIPVGICLWFFVYSTWQGKFIHLEDLFVLPEYRHQGIGTQMLLHLVKIARNREKCMRLQWQVLDWNKSARAYYEKSVGARELMDPLWITCRMGPKEMDAFIDARTTKTEK